MYFRNTKKLPLNHFYAQEASRNFFDNTLCINCNIFIIHIIITFLRGYIYANELFCQISGYSVEELMGKNHRILNSGTHDTLFWKRMYQTIAQGNVWHNEVCNKSKDGELYWVDTTIIPFCNV